MAYYDRKWNDIFESFKHMFPVTAEKIVDWWPSGRNEITVQFSDKTRMIYDGLTDSGRTIRRDRIEANEDDEEKWRIHFAYKLNRKVAESGLLNQDIAEQVGITPAMLSRYCKGTSVPSFIKIRKLAKALQCSVTELTEFVDIE